MFGRALEPAKSLTREQFEKILKFIIKQKKPTWVQDLALIMTAEYFGLRADEIGQLKKIYYDRRAKTMFCLRQKNSNNNILKIMDESLITLLNYHIDTNPNVKNSEYIFVTSRGNRVGREYAYKHFMQYVNEADFFLPDYTCFHTLKHTRGQYLADMGFDIKEVQYWLGHKSVENTYIYFQFSKIQQESMYKKMAKKTDKKKDYLCIKEVLEIS